MSSIDERIVGMQFNNGQFERGVSTSISTLDKLKRSLNLEGAARGLSNLQAVGDRFTLGGLSAGISGAQRGLTALGVAGVTALSTIAYQATIAGQQLLSSLTIDPIKAGFGEYETKMGSIQTILANTARYGTKLPEVVKNLDELNTYADKTIYSFGDMTRNIGLFTNSGLKVGDATSIIKGFSNEAAASGTNSSYAANAAYQLSQALNTGTIRLMDWRSLTNAGMGNKNMQRGIIDIASAMGEFSKHGTTADAVQKDFTGSLEKGWLTADVMSKYLKIMSGDMTVQQQKAIGLTDAQVKMFKAQQKTAEDAATKVRTLTQLMGTIREAVGSSWAGTFDVIFGDFNEATDLFTGINDTVGSMITSVGDARNKLLKGWDKLGGRSNIIAGISNAFQFLLAVMKPITDAFREIFPATTAQQLVNFTNGIAMFLGQLRLAEPTAEKLKTTFKGVFAVFDIVRMVIVGLITTIGGLFGEMGKGAGGILDISSGLGQFAINVRDALKNGEGLAGFFRILGTVLKVPVTLISSLIGFLGALAQGFADVKIDNFGDKAGELGEKLTPLQVVLKVLDTFAGKVKQRFDQLSGGIGPVLDAVGNFIGNVGSKINEGVKAINWGTALTAVQTGFFAALTLLVGKFLKGGGGGFKLDIGDNGLFGSIKETFEGLTGVLEAMQQNLKANVLLKIAGALAILTASVVALSLIDSARLASAMTAMTVMFAQLGGSMKLFEKFVTPASVKQVFLVSAMLIALGVAIGILTLSVMQLSKLDWNELSRGLSGVAAILLILAGFTKLVGSGTQTNLMRLGLAMIPLGIGLKFMASAIADLAGLDWNELARGLTGLALTLGALALFSKIQIAGKNAVKNAISIAILGVALKIMASALQDFGNLSWEQMSKAAASLVGVLTAIVLAMKFMPKGGGLVKSALQLAIFGGALKIVASALEDFGGMSWDEIGRGLTVMAGALLLLVVAMKFMSGAIPGAVAMLLVATALNVLVPALQAMGAMDLESIGKALGLLAASLIIIAGSLYLMSGALPGAAALLVASAALTVLAVALSLMASIPIAAIGIALGTLVAVFVILGLASLALAPAIPTLLLLGAAIALIGAGIGIAAAGVGLLAIGLVALAGLGAAGIATLITSIGQLLDAVPELAEKFGAGIIAIADAIGNSAPAMINAFVKILMAMLQAGEKVIPQLIKTATKIIKAFVNAVVEMVPFLVTAGIKLVTGILNGIGDNIGKLAAAGTKIITEYLKAIGDNLPKIVDAGVKMIIKLVNGVADGIRDNRAKMQAAGKNLAGAIIEGIVGGITDGLASVIQAATSIGGAALEAVKAILGIHSPSREMKILGEYTTEGYAIGLTGGLDKVQAAFDKMKDMLTSLKDATTSDITSFQDKITSQNETIAKDVEAINKQKKAVASAKADRKSGLEVDKATVRLAELTNTRKREVASIAKYTKASKASYKKDGDAKRAQAKIDLASAKVRLASNAVDIREAQATLKKAKAEKKNGTAVTAANKKLADLRKDRDKDKDTLNEHNAALAQAEDEQRKAELATEAYNEQLALHGDELKQLAIDNDTLTDRIKDQTKAVDDAIKTRDDYNKSIKDSFSALDSINKDTELPDYFGDLEDQVTKVNEFAQKIQDLRSRGLNDTAYTKLLSSGTEALPFLDQLLNKGQDGVSEFNLLTDQLNTASSGLGAQAAANLYQAGVDSAQGLLNGLTSEQANVVAKMDQIAAQMVQAVKDRLGIHSPSREFAELGSYSAQGLAGGITAGSRGVEKAAESVGNNAINTLRNTLTGLSSAVAMDMDLQPTIRPVLDLSAIKKDSSLIGGMLGRPVMAVDTSTASATAASNGYLSNQEQMLAAKEEVAYEPSSKTVNFTQINNSPKALSRIEIYRQTNNQLSTLKED